MTRFGRWAAMTASVALAASVAVAQDRGTGTEGMPGRSPSGQGATSSPGTMGVGGSTAAMPGECAHKLTGTVKQVDKAAGTVSVDVAGADSLELKLPANELAGFETGDQVVVSMGIRETREGTAPARGTDTPAR